MVPEPAIQQLFDLTGKVVLLTGATGHLGAAMARALAEAGASVLATSRDAKRAAALAASLPQRGSARHFGLALDHQEHDQLELRFAEALALTGQIDVLVNNGHEPLVGDWTTVTADEFNRQLGNATGYFLLARCLRNHIAQRNLRTGNQTASIVLLGSMYALVGSYPDAYRDICPASPVAYHMLKGGIVQLARHLAVYWAGDGVRVNCLSPGPFPRPQAPEEMVARLCEKSPLKRVGRPEELKGAIVFLASDASSYMTGQNLVIDGGWTAW